MKIKRLTNEERERLQQELTDDVVRNIQIMAPYLDKAAQNRVFGLMQGVTMQLDELDKKKIG